MHRDRDARGAPFQAAPMGFDDRVGQHVRHVAQLRPADGVLNNGHYDTWCYLPIVATVTFNDEPEQFAVAAVLPSPYAPAYRGTSRRRFRDPPILRNAFSHSRRGAPQFEGKGGSDSPPR